LVVAAIATLPVRSCAIDGEAIVSDDSGLAVLELLGSWRHHRAAALCAFDLLELDGQDLRQPPIEETQTNAGQAHTPAVSRLGDQPAPRRRWRCRLPAGLQARLRGYRVEAVRLALAIMSL
jgi:hypothetical protein